MNATDRHIVNALQNGLAVCERPFAAAAENLDMSEAELIDSLQALVGDGVLSRFGPMYHAERLGGGLSLCALSVPDGRFDAVAEMVNSFPEVAHNYARDHMLNMWFVLATETPERIAEVIVEIEAEIGLKVYNMPKIEEFFIGLRLEA